MGNLISIIATENKNEFNLSSIKELIENKFVNFKVSAINQSILIEYRDNVVSEIIKGKFIDEEMIEDELLNAPLNRLSDDVVSNLQYLLDVEIWNEDSILLTYPSNYNNYNKHKELVEYLQTYFNAYVIDEGVFPEFIKPS